MKRIYTDEIKFLKKGTVLRYTSYDYNEDNKQIFFDAIIEFNIIDTKYDDSCVICNLLHLKESQVQWSSRYVNFYLDLEDDEEVYYMGPKEDYPEYFV
jgi:hypothetical protein